MLQPQLRVGENGIDQPNFILLIALDIQHRRTAEYLHSAAVCAIQEICIERVFGIVIAAGRTIAATNTFIQLNVSRINNILFCSDCDICRIALATLPKV